MSKTLRGLVAAPFTPFDNKGNLNLKVVPKLAKLYVKNGVSGSFIAGTTGECASLTLDEKIALMEAWADCKSKKLALAFMLGGTNQRDMIKLAKASVKNKMDAVSIVSPYYFKAASVRELVDFCKPIAEAAENLPFYYYHIPGMSGGNYSMQSFIELADAEISNFMGIKFSHLNLMDFQQCKLYKKGKIKMLWGTDEALLSGLIAGADGAVGSTYNYASPLYIKLLNAYQKGDSKKARSLQDKSVAMVNILIKYGGINAGKAFMKIIGVDCGWCRPPLQALSKSNLKAMAKELHGIGFFDYCSTL